MHTYIRTHARARTHTHTHTHTHIDIYIYRDIDACVIGLDLARFVLFLSLPKRTVPWVCAHTFNNNNNNNNNNTHTDPACDEDRASLTTRTTVALEGLRLSFPFSARCTHHARVRERS